MSAAEMSYDVRYFLAFINPSYGVNANRMKKFAFRVDEKLYDFDELTVASAIFFSFSYFAFKSDIFKLFLNAISVLTYLLTTYSFGRYLRPIPKFGRTLLLHNMHVLLSK